MLPALTLHQPSVAPEAVAAAVCSEEIDPPPALITLLHEAGGKGFLVLASDPDGFLFHSERGAWRVNRYSLRRLPLHSVLPAKGIGGFYFFLDIMEGDDLFALEILHRGAHSEELAAQCEATARDFAKWLGVPLMILDPSYDC